VCQQPDRTSLHRQASEDDAEAPGGNTRADALHRHCEQAAHERLKDPDHRCDYEHRGSAKGRLHDDEGEHPEYHQRVGLPRADHTAPAALAPEEPHAALLQRDEAEHHAPDGSQQPRSPEERTTSKRERNRADTHSDPGCEQLARRGSEGGAALRRRHEHCCQCCHDQDEGYEVDPPQALTNEEVVGDDRAHETTGDDGHDHLDAPHLEREELSDTSGDVKHRPKVEAPISEQVYQQREAEPHALRCRLGSLELEHRRTRERARGHHGEEHSHRQPSVRGCDRMTAMSNPRVLIVSARLGGGHDGAAQAIAARLERAGVQVRIEDFLDAAPRLGTALETIFRVEVERAPWAYHLEFELWSHLGLLTKLARSAFRHFFGGRFVEWIEAFDPDMILATHPFPAQLLGELRRRDHPSVRGRHLATFLTDFSVHPLWVHPAVDTHFAVSASAATQARRRARLDREVIRVGPFVDERYFAVPDREVARRALGLPREATIALVVGGSWGVGKLLETVRQLAASGAVVPVLLCGRNEELERRARTIPGVVAVGWTTQVDWWLAAADVVVQNAGGLSALEAMAAGRPVLSYEPIAGHGTENVAAMAESGVTYWAKTPEELVGAVVHYAQQPLELTLRALEEFLPRPEAPLLTQLVDVTSPPPRRARRSLRRGSKVLVGLASAFLGANLISGLIGYQGLNLVATTKPSRTIFLGALLGPAALGSPSIQQFLASHDVAAVVTAQLASHDPSVVAEAALDGVTIVNGGSGSRASDFSFIVPANDLEQGRAAIAAATGDQVNVYVPQNTINAVDLAWAALHHQSVIPARIVSPARLPARLDGSIAIELDLTSETPADAARALRLLLRRVRQDHLTPSPLGALARAAETPL